MQVGSSATFWGNVCRLVLEMGGVAWLGLVDRGSVVGTASQRWPPTPGRTRRSSSSSSSSNGSNGSAAKKRGPKPLQRYVGYIKVALRTIGQKKGRTAEGTAKEITTIVGRKYVRRWVDGWCSVTHARTNTTSAHTHTQRTQHTHPKHDTHTAQYNSPHACSSHTTDHAHHAHHCQNRYSAKLDKGLENDTRKTPKWKANIAKVLRSTKAPFEKFKRDGQCLYRLRVSGANNNGEDGGGDGAGAGGDV